MVPFTRWALRALCLVAVLSSMAAIKQPIRKPVYDPDAPVVPLFEALDRELVEVTVIAKNSHEANLFVTGKGTQAINVQLPDAVVAVQVLKQGFGPGIGNGAASGNGSGNGADSGGQAQPVGGGAKSGGNGLSNMSGNGPQGNAGNLPGSGIFSVPVEKTIQIPLKTVCLAHGQPNPQAKMQYKLVPLEEFSSDPRLQETLKRFVRGEIDEEVAQAAAWHFTNGRSWKALAQERVGHVGGNPGKPLFNKRQLTAARELSSLLNDLHPRPEGAKSSRR
ncbi:MAG: hypothetical protein ACKV0T_02780 [Planctomycetales bacterium]